jgi:hypothetical protein
MVLTGAFLLLSRFADLHPDKRQKPDGVETLRPVGLLPRGP